MANYKKSLRNASRIAYKATGYKNPMKKGRLMTSRITKQLPKLMSDVLTLKKMINAEKKANNGQLFNNSVAQVNGNSSGHQSYDVTPLISQGVTGQTRNGNSVKIHSMVFKGQVLQQSANHHQGKLKFQIFLNKGTPFTSWTSGDVTNILAPNPINTVYDFNSNRSMDTFKNWQLIKTKIINIKQDNYSGVQGWADFVIPIKFKSYHVKYDDNNTNAITNGQLIMVVTADSGNRNTSTASSLPDIPVTAINTGFDVKVFQQYWYYDN